jgi:hypothetical protein
MVVKRAKVKASERTARQALQNRGIRFRKMRSKPRLTAADVKTRYAFAKKYKKKPKAWWTSKLDLSHDMKNFPVYPHEEARAYAAQREVRGAYRGMAQGLGEGYVVCPKHLRYNTGVRPVKIDGGVGKGKMLLWEDIGKKWNSSVASSLYLNSIQPALRRAYPRKRQYLLLEDNDPTGYKSKAAERAKVAMKIKVFQIPKRSPDLSVMDYAIWKPINRAMRTQEKRFNKRKRETRVEYIARLRRTAMGLKKAFINKAIQNMKERCERVYAAKGQHIEEGGKSRFV